MFPMYVKSERVMVLSYKPDRGHIIRDDSNNKWYNVDHVEGRKVYASPITDPYAYLKG